MSVTISGHSDDNIKIEGDIVEEFYAPDAAGGDIYYIALSNGMVIQGRYADDGIWRFYVAIFGGANHVATVVRGSHATNTDWLTINDDVYWALCGKHVAFPRGGTP